MNEQVNTGGQGPHLSAEQIGELLGSEAAASLTREQAEARAHLYACPQCTAELDSLREVLALFRETTSAYATEQLARVPRPSFARLPVRRPFTPGLLWAAAGLLVIAGLVPLEMQHQRGLKQLPPAGTSSPAARAVSDEALLEEINLELAASVPASMQPLDEPRGTAVSTSEPQLSPTRKN